MTETQSSSTDARTDSRPRPVHGADTGSEKRSLRGRFSTDDRGQSELLGAILLFGLAIAVLVLIQVAAVPSWNQALEFEHNQRVNEDFDRMGQIISDVAGDGGDRSVAVELGVRYPTRPFLFNPGPATGQIATTGERAVYINNSNVAGAGGYWQQSSMRFDTRSVQYSPSYNEYRSAPETTYEYGRVVRDFPNEYNTSDEGVPIIDGTNINLIFVNGELSEATSTTETVPIEGTSAPSNGVRLSSAGGNEIEITLPTEYPDRLANRLNDEPNVNNTVVNGDSVVVTLDKTKTYNLRMARIDVGPSSFTNNAAYVAVKRGQTNFFANGSEDNPVTFEVRDRFNNPIAGEDVEFSTTCGSISSEGTSDENGEVVASLEVPESPCSGTVTATLASNPSISKEFDFNTGTVGIGNFNDGEGDGEGTDDPVSGINPAPGGDAVRFVSATVETSQNSASTVTFDNDAGTTMTISRIRISYYFEGGGGDYPSKVYYIYNTENVAGDIPGPFVGFSGPTLDPDDGKSGSADDADTSDQASIELQFDYGNSKTGIAKDDFMIVSIEYNVGGGDTQIYSYFISGTE